MPNTLLRKETTRFPRSYTPYSITTPKQEKKLSYTCSSTPNLLTATRQIHISLHLSYKFCVVHFLERNTHILPHRRRSRRRIANLTAVASFQVSPYIHRHPRTLRRRSAPDPQLFRQIWGPVLSLSLSLTLLTDPSHTTPHSRCSTQERTGRADSLLELRREREREAVVASRFTSRLGLRRVELRERERETMMRRVREWVFFVYRYRGVRLDKGYIVLWSGWVTGNYLARWSVGGWARSLSLLFLPVRWNNLDKHWYSVHMIGEEKT